jgi:hypothetical protein
VFCNIKNIIKKKSFSLKFWAGQEKFGGKFLAG